jgi:hypothetical protein
MIPFWVWLLWAGIGLGMEIFALFNSTPNDTLTATIVNHFPGAWVAAGAAWVGVHFASALKDKGKQR